MLAPIFSLKKPNSPKRKLQNWEQFFYEPDLVRGIIGILGGGLLKSVSLLSVSRTTATTCSAREKKKEIRKQKEKKITSISPGKGNEGA